MVALNIFRGAYAFWIGPEMTIPFVWALSMLAFSAPG